MTKFDISRSLKRFKDKVDRLAYTGVLDGFILEVNPLDFTQFRVLAGTGDIQDLTDPLKPVHKMVKLETTGWINGTQFGGSATTTFVLISETGTVIQQGTLPDIDQERTLLSVGNIQHNSGLTAFDGVTAPTQTPTAAFGLSKTFEDFLEGIGGVNISGSEFTANGANLNYNRSPGIDISIGRNFETDTNRPNTVSSPGAEPINNGVRVWLDGLGALQFAPSNLIDPSLYNNGGTLTILQPNRWQIQRIFHFPSSNTSAVYYGNAQYKTLEEAEAALFSSDPFVEHPITLPASFRSWLIVRNGATDLSSLADAKFITAGAIRGAGGGSGSGTIPTLQGSYDLSADPEIIVDSTRGALTVRDNATPIGAALFEVQSNAPSNLFEVDVSKVRSNVVNEISATSSHLKLIESDNSDKTWDVGVDSGNFKISETGVSIPLTIEDGLPTDFITMTPDVSLNSTVSDQLKLASDRGVRLFLDADTDNSNETDTARIVFQGDGSFIYGIIGHSGSSGKGADGEDFDGASSNSLCIHTPEDEDVYIGANGKAYMELSTTGNGILNVFGEASFDSGFFLKFGDLNMGVCEYVDDNLRIHGDDRMEITVDDGQVIIGNTGSANNTSDATSFVFMNIGTRQAVISDTGDESPTASTILELKSTTKAFVPTKMTTTQRDAMTALAGMVVYNTTTNKHQGYNGTTWNDFY